MKLPDIATAVQEMRVSKYAKWPCSSNRASSLGHECNRKLFYDRTAWRDATPPPDQLKLIFQEGDLHETAVLRDIQEAGFQVIEQQVALEWEEYQLTGHVDAMVIVPGGMGQAFPIDVKSMSSHIWDSIFKDGPRSYEWDEVKEGFWKKSWTRKYAGQLILYMLMKNCEAGALICKSKQTGACAQVNIPLDLELGEKLIQQAEAVNEAVELGMEPDRIPWDEDLCGKCEHLATCLPGREGQDPIKFLENEEVEALCDICERHEEGHRLYNRADKRRKAWAKARPEDKICTGRWLAQTKRGAKVTTKWTNIQESDDALEVEQAEDQAGA